MKSAKKAVERVESRWKKFGAKKETTILSLLKCSTIFAFEEVKTIYSKSLRKAAATSATYDGITAHHLNCTERADALDAGTIGSVAQTDSGFRKF